MFLGGLPRWTLDATAAGTVSTVAPNSSRRFGRPVRHGAFTCGAPSCRKAPLALVTMVRSPNPTYRLATLFNPDRPPQSFAHLQLVQLLLRHDGPRLGLLHPPLQLRLRAGGERGRQVVGRGRRVGKRSHLPEHGEFASRCYGRRQGCKWPYRNRISTRQARISRPCSWPP
jgi:hypothetical protein